MTDRGSDSSLHRGKPSKESPFLTYFSISDFPGVSPGSPSFVYSLHVSIHLLLGLAVPLSSLVPSSLSNPCSTGISIEDCDSHPMFSFRSFVCVSFLSCKNLFREGQGAVIRRNYLEGLRVCVVYNTPRHSVSSTS